MSTANNITPACQYCERFMAAGYVTHNGKPAHLVCMLEAGDVTEEVIELDLKEHCVH